MQSTLYRLYMHSYALCIQKHIDYNQAIELQQWLSFVEPKRAAKRKQRNDREKARLLGKEIPEEIPIDVPNRPLKPYELTMENIVLKPLTAWVESVRKERYAIIKEKGVGFGLGLKPDQDIRSVVGEDRHTFIEVIISIFITLILDEDIVPDQDLSTIWKEKIQGAFQQFHTDFFDRADHDPTLLELCAMPSPANMETAYHDLGIDIKQCARELNLGTYSQRMGAACGAGGYTIVKPFKKSTRSGPSVNKEKVARLRQQNRLAEARGSCYKEGLAVAKAKQMALLQQLPAEMTAKSFLKCEFHTYRVFSWLEYITVMAGTLSTGVVTIRKRMLVEDKDRPGVRREKEVDVPVLCSLQSVVSSILNRIQDRNSWICHPQESFKLRFRQAADNLSAESRSTYMAKLDSLEAVFKMLFGVSNSWTVEEVEMAIIGRHKGKEADVDMETLGLLMKDVADFKSILLSCKRFYPFLNGLDDDQRLYFLSGSLAHYIYVWLMMIKEKVENFSEGDLFIDIEYTKIYRSSPSQVTNQEYYLFPIRIQAGTVMGTLKCLWQYTDSIFRSQKNTLRKNAIALLKDMKTSSTSDSMEFPIGALWAGSKKEMACHIPVLRGSSPDREGEGDEGIQSDIATATAKWEPLESQEGTAYSYSGTGILLDTVAENSELRASSLDRHSSLRYSCRSKPASLSSESSGYLSASLSQGSSDGSERSWFRRSGRHSFRLGRRHPIPPPCQDPKKATLSSPVTYV